MMHRFLHAATLLAVGLALPAAPARAQADIDPSESVGEIKHFAGDFVPRGWAACDGTVLGAAQRPGLAFLLGNAFGGAAGKDGPTTFALPTLPGAAPGTPARPRPVMCVDGIPPTDGAIAPWPDAGVIRLVPKSRPLPPTWVACRGQALQPGEAGGLVAVMGTPEDQPVTLPNLPDEADGRLAWAITTEGFPVPGGFLGDVRRWPAAAPVPAGWVRCDGARLPVNRNLALQAILGYRYGGDGATWFAVPDLPDEGGARWILCTRGLFPTQY